MFEKILDEIESMGTAKAEALAAGAAEDFAQYQLIVGEIAGLKLAFDVVKQAQSLPEDDELD